VVLYKKDDTKEEEIVKELEDFLNE